MAIADFLDRQMSVQRETVTASATGGAIRTYATIVPSLAVAVAPASDVVVAAYAQRKMKVDYTIWTSLPAAAVPANGSGRPGFLLNDKLVDAADGRTYVIQACELFRNANVGEESIYEMHCSTDGT
jgi:hypothetical protein